MTLKFARPNLKTDMEKTSDYKTMHHIEYIFQIFNIHGDDINIFGHEIKKQKNINTFTSFIANIYKYCIAMNSYSSLYATTKDYKYVKYFQKNKKEMEQLMYSYPEYCQKLFSYRKFKIKK